MKTQVVACHVMQLNSLKIHYDEIMKDFFLVTGKLKLKLYVNEYCLSNART